MNRASNKKQKLCSKCKCAANIIFKNDTRGEGHPSDEAAAAGEEELVEKPRRFMTPYIAFVKSAWGEYRATNPEVRFNKDSFKKLAIELAAKWKEMPEEEKAPFEEQSAEEKATYQEKMVAYKAQQLELKKSTPKRPLSSYMLFACEQREKVRQEMGPEAKVVEVAKELGRRWVALEPTLKESYKAKASQARQEYYDLSDYSGDESSAEESDSSGLSDFTGSSSIYSSYSSDEEGSYSFSEDADYWVILSLSPVLVTSPPDDALFKQLNFYFHCYYYYYNY